MPVGSSALGVPGRGLVQISDIRLCIINVPVASINLVDSETGVQVGVRSDGGPNPSSRDCASRRFGGGVVEECEFVVMGMSKELFSNDVGGVALDDLVVECGPVLETVGLGGSNVTDDPDALAGIFGGLELGDKPFKFSVGVVVVCLLK